MAAAIVTLLLLGGIIVSLIARLPTIRSSASAFLAIRVGSEPDVFGALVPIYGTIVTSLIALLIAVPVSFGIALFLTELSPAWLRRPLGIAIELLAAIPSIVYGMWGLLVFAPIFANTSRSRSAACSGRVGARPAVRPAARHRHARGRRHPRDHDHPVHRLGDARRVRSHARAAEGIGLRLGCTTWEVMWKVVLPYRAGVIGGVMLGLGRALGETMAVTFVIGNTNLLDSVSLFAPGNSITSALANEFAEANRACIRPR
jgi:phosphate transport system permease protein